MIRTDSSPHHVIAHNTSVDGRARVRGGASPSTQNAEGANRANRANREGADQSPERAMSAAQLSRYWSAIEAAAFRDDKMKVIQRVAREAYLTVAQAEVLVESLTFSRDRKEAILSLYPRLTDPDEVQSLYRLLDHSSHRRDVRRRVRQLGARRQP